MVTKVETISCIDIWCKPKYLENGQSAARDNICVFNDYRKSVMD